MSARATATPSASPTPSGTSAAAEPAPSAGGAPPLPAKGSFGPSGARDAGPPLVALVGRPNSGKSSLYNAVTGGDAHVGNFPGVTVDILDARVPLPGGAEVEIADLPGFYSIDAVVDAATDEGVARRFLDGAVAAGRALVVVQVIDATQLALGLRLTRELVRRGWPLIVVATQRDVLEAEGRALDAAAVERAIGVPVLAVSARDARTRATVLRAIEARLAAPPPDAHARDDGSDGAEVTWSPDEVARRAVSDRAASIPEATRRRTFTARADAVLLHPLLGPILFLGLMAAVFAAVFLIADPASDVLDAGIGWLRARIDGALGQGLVASFLSDGVLGGAGTVLAFMPQIVILTVAMELLEASGYLARGAFLVDRLLRLLGLSGRSFVPLLMGHACAVPAISATRILRDPRERLTTILVIPLMTCSARIPTYALILATFFGGRSALFRAAIFVGLYFTGILGGLVASLVLRRTATKGRALPLVLEMPQYRAPQLRVVARQGWRATTRFVREVGTTILAVSAVLWALLTVPLPRALQPHLDAAQLAPDRTEQVDEPIERSIAAGIGKAVEPITRPIGFDWRIDVGLIGSFGAREVMVGTMGIIFGIENAGDEPAPLTERMRTAKRPDGSPLYTARTGLALLAFFVFACQCMSTVAAIWRETKSWRWPAFVVAYTYVVAYVAAFVTYHAAALLGVS